MDPKTFIKSNATNFSNFENKMISIAIHKENVIVGDNKGNVYSYQISSKKNSLSFVNKIYIQKGKIEQILIFPDDNVNVAYILLNQEIYIYFVPKLDLIEKINFKEGFYEICLNNNLKEFSHRLLAITKKKKLKFYKFEIDKKKPVEISPNKELTVVDNPEINAFVWYDYYFCYSNKKKIIWLNIETGESFENEVPDVKIIKTIDDKIIAATETFIIFFYANIKKSKSNYNLNPINFVEEKNLINIIFNKNYLITFHENYITVNSYNNEQYTLVQKEALSNEDGKFIIQYNKEIYFVTQSGNVLKFWEFKEENYENQIDRLLNKGLFKEALEKINDNIDVKNVKFKLEKLEKFFLDSAWISLKLKRFDESKNYLHLCNFNPFEFIYMFLNMFNISILHSDIEQFEIKNKVETNQIENLMKSPDELKNIYKYLIEILSIKRNFLLNKYEKNLEQIVNFDSSSYSIINLKDSKTEITVSKTLEMINSILIKCQIKLKSPPKEISLIIDNKSFECKGLCDFEKDKFFINEENKIENKFAMAYFYEKKKDFKKALENWKYFGETYSIENINDKKCDIFSFEAKERTKKIFMQFTKNNEEYFDLFNEYIKWIIKKYPKDAFDIAINIKIIKIDFFLDNIIKEVDKENTNNINNKSFYEQFLEYINEKQPNEHFQTKLINLYIDELKIYNKENGYNDEEKIIKDFHLGKRDVYEKLMKLINDKNSIFSKENVYEKIKNTWLFKAKIILLGLLKKHEQALEELFVNSIEDFKKMEDYCVQNLKSKPDIFQIYIGILCKKVKEFQSKKIDSEKNSLNENYINSINNYNEQIIYILKKYGEISNIDPLFVFNNIDPSINVCKNKNFLEYLIKIVRDYTNLSNKYKIGNSLSEIALLYKEKETYEVKKRHVMISQDTYCELCRKKIGSTMFVLYPNNKIYHQKCGGNNMSIDPTTGVDFTKKKFAEC